MLERGKDHDMLSARDVTVEISGKRLLDSVSLDVLPGQVTALIGPNGAGKSTLLKTLTGEHRPSRGCILIDGTDIATLKPRELAFRRAVVPQASNLQFPFTVEEVVLLGTNVPGFNVSRSGRDDSARLTMREAMQRADVAHLAGRHYTTLSGGERQRVHLARALCQLASSQKGSGTRVLLLDEPTSSLDLAHQLLILDAARNEASAGLAVLVVLHDFNLAARYGDTIALILHGRLVAVGSSSQIIQSDLLSQAFGCLVHANQLPADKVPYVLAQACALNTV